MDDFRLLPEHEADRPSKGKGGEWFVRRVQEKDLSHQTALSGSWVSFASVHASARASHRGPSIVSGTCAPTMRTSPGVSWPYQRWSTARPTPKISVAPEKVVRYPINTPQSDEIERAAAPGIIAMVPGAAVDARP
ncbi:hypothetical protein Arub01_37450 [Actinomadura rubrobrunea]|uniref:Uncharacterized protein n=1 Tax=Actinomadura rubrobrunea TaxID=115335 RepID=A0A9W6PYH0_9ACTN|nr:hypothetical protein Arub01_37450 [Actinomadura rubrobrunea]